MAEWAAHTGSGQDLNQIYTGSNIAISPYASNNGVTYVQGNMPLTSAGTTYSAYSSPYVTNHNPSHNMMYLPSNPVSLNYQLASHQTRLPHTHARTTAANPFYHPTLQSPRTIRQPLRCPVSHDIPLIDTEDQESVNQDTQRSEPVEPPLEGYPDVNEFDRLMNHYVTNLSPKKQDKALIHSKRAANIKAVLIDKKTTSVESAQFRFWVKKMFTLYPNDPSIPARRKKICHDNKPVAIREKLFKILTRAHKQCQHGGRDKTSAQVRRIYSWVPKELISRFVKICPTCQVRRGTNRGSPADSDEHPDLYTEQISSNTSSPAQSRRDSVATSHSSLHSPLQMNGFSSTFQQQNRWMTPIDAADKLEDPVPKLESTGTNLGGGFTDTSQSRVRPLNLHSPSTYSTMDSMDLSSSGYVGSNSQHMPYHTNDVRYTYKADRFKRERPY